MKLARSCRTAFTLLEVLIAMGIFFVAVFAVLQLTSQNLRLARALKQNNTVDAGSLAAELSLTNILDEGFTSGDFGELHPGYTWAREVYMVSTNGLFQVDFTVIAEGAKSVKGAKRPAISQTSIYLWRPASVGRPLGAR